MLRRLAGRPWHSYAVRSHEVASEIDRALALFRGQPRASQAQPAQFHRTTSRWSSRPLPGPEQQRGATFLSSLRAPRRKTVPSRGARGARRAQAMDGPGVGVNRTYLQSARTSAVSHVLEAGSCHRPVGERTAVLVSAREKSYACFLVTGGLRWYVTTDRRPAHRCRYCGSCRFRTLGA
jgi:hypothetical protein